MAFPIEDQSWNEIGTLLVNVLELPREERADFLDAACQSKPDLRAEIDSLLAAYENAPSYFGTLAEGLLPVPGDEETRAPGVGDPYGIVGNMLDRYHVLEVLGHGGMGVIYRAEDTRLQRSVALKLLPPYMSGQETARVRFLTEARAASALDHPNICTIYEVAEGAEGALYIAMAYYTGEALTRKIARGPLPIGEALDIAVQMARGLGAAHTQGIVHRDVKPGNVMLVDDRDVKLLDFGLAKLAGATQITRTGAMLGTAAYMSPEQVRGEEVDHRTDIWSLGAVLYEMITGRRPFPGDFAPAVVYAILNQDPEPATGLRDGLPMQLALIINKMLAKPAPERYQRTKDLLFDLESVMQRSAARSRAEQDVLPAQPMASAEIPPIAPPPILEDGPVAILVVDDEPELELLVRQSFRKLIRGNEWRFFFASNGQEALEALKAHPEIALVLTDINMPGMSGLELLTRINALNRLVKAVVVSAYSDLGNIRTAMNQGAFDFVTKPIDFLDLEVTIQRAHREYRSIHEALETQHRFVSLQKEFEVARRIQEAILPVAFPKRPGIDPYAFMVTARDVGGTFYDFFEISERRVGFLVGDVAGKGVSAALFVTMSQTLLKGLSLQGGDPGDCLSTMNHLLFPEGFPDMYVTVFCGMLDTETGKLLYCNAGHPAPYMVHADGNVAPLNGDPDAPVWHTRDYLFQTRETVLPPDSGLFLYTRGVTESVDQHGHVFSSERLAALLREVHGAASAEMIRSVVRAVMRHAQDLQRDLTVLALRRLKE